MPHPKGMWAFGTLEERMEYVILLAAIVLVISELRIVGMWLQRRMSHDEVVADLGRSQHGMRDLAVGIASAALGALATLQGGTVASPIALAGALLLLASPLLIVGALGRVTVTREGIGHLLRFEPWENIERWEEEEDGVLVTYHRHRYFDPTDLRTLILKRRMWHVDPSRIGRLRLAMDECGLLRVGEKKTLPGDEDAR